MHHLSAILLAFACMCRLAYMRSVGGAGGGAVSAVLLPVCLWAEVEVRAVGCLPFAGFDELHCEAMLIAVEAGESYSEGASVWGMESLRQPEMKMACAVCGCVRGIGMFRFGDNGRTRQVLRVQENLRSWRARMRFKKAIIATVATTRLHAIMRRAAARPDAKPIED